MSGYPGNTEATLRSLRNWTVGFAAELDEIATQLQRVSVLEEMCQENVAVGNAEARRADAAEARVAELERNEADQRALQRLNSELAEALRRAGAFIEDDTCRHDHEKAHVLSATRDALAKVPKEPTS